MAYSAYGYGWLNECDNAPYQEGFKEDFKNRFRSTDKDGNPEKMRASVIKFLPRAIKALIDAIKKLVSKIIAKVRSKLKRDGLDPKQLKKIKVKCDIDLDFLIETLSETLTCLKNEPSPDEMEDLISRIFHRTYSEPGMERVYTGDIFNKKLQKLIDVANKVGKLEIQESGMNPDSTALIIDMIEAINELLGRMDAMLIKSIDVEEVSVKFMESYETNLFDFEVGEYEDVVTESAEADWLDDVYTEWGLAGDAVVGLFSPIIGIIMATIKASNAPANVKQCLKNIAGFFENIKDEDETLSASQVGALVEQLKSLRQALSYRVMSSGLRANRTLADDLYAATTVMLYCFRTKKPNADVKEAIEDFKNAAKAFLEEWV